MKTRSINRIYIPQLLNINDTITLQDEVLHYISNVLRLKPNDKLRIFNNLSGEFVANIISFGKKEVHLNIEKLLRPPFLGIKLVIAPCIIKNDKMADMISMAVQLGVTEIVPIISDHTVHRNFKKERFEKVSIEAAEQSERLEVPKIGEPITLQGLIESRKFDYIVFGNENEKKKVILSSNIAKLENIVLLLGPEGGFSDKELDMLEKAKAISVSLGENILRAETAAVKLIAYVQFLREQHIV